MEPVPEQGFVYHGAVRFLAWVLGFYLSESIHIRRGKSGVLLSKNVFRRAWDALEEADRYALFLNQIGSFTLDEIAEYLRQLGPEYQTLADRSRRHEGKLCDTEYNRKLAENLEKIGYLSSYRIEDFGDTDENAYNEENRGDLVCWIRKES